MRERDSPRHSSRTEKFQEEKVETRRRVGRGRYSKAAFPPPQNENHSRDQQKESVETDRRCIENGRERVIAVFVEM